MRIEADITRGPAISERKERAALYILFFISGLCGILYEVVWIRILGLIFGNTTLSVSTVLVSYMMGMAFGSLVFGDRADRFKSLLIVYAWMELGVGVTAGLAYLARGILDQVFALLFIHSSGHMLFFHLIQFFLSFVFLLPATFLMGGTLPVLSRLIVRRMEEVGRGVGLLYSCNTLGAVFGAFATGFFLIRILGVGMTVLMGMLGNLIVAAAALWLARCRSTAPGEYRRVTYRSTDLEKAAFCVMALSGFTALSYEVLWNRILVFILTNSIFAFTVMLVTFLTGLALGGRLGGWMAQRISKPVAWLGYVQWFIGAGVLLSTVILTRLSSIHQALFQIDASTSWWQWNAVRFLEAFLVILLPTLGMGASFPLAGRMAVPGLDRLAASLGRLGFWNTLGGVIGSFLTGFFLIRWLGTPATFMAMASINLLLGTWLVLGTGGIKRIRKPVLIIVSLVAVVGMTAAAPERMFFSAFNNVEDDFPLIDYREGIEGTVTIHEAVRPMERLKRIDVDGLNVAGNSFMLQTLQILQGHIPMLIHSSPGQVLQIGFGTGQTTHSAFLHPLKSYRVVEISRDVLDLASLHFKDLHGEVMDDPRFRVSILDGRNYIKYSREPLDIIMNDANYAVATGSASLFTREHFETCRNRLRSNGILSTWMTIDLDPRDFAIVLKTFQSVFPYCILWMAPNCINKQVVLVGSVSPWRIDFRRIEERFRDADFRKDLEAVNIHSVYDLLSCIVLDRVGIVAASEGASVNTDDRPILEYSTRAIRSRDLCAYQNLGKILTHRPDLRSMLTDLEEDKEVESRLRTYEAASKRFLLGMLKTYEGHTEEGLKLLLEGSRLIPESDLARYYFEKTDLINRQLISEASSRPGDARVRLQFSRHLIGLGKYDEALRELKRIRYLRPSNPWIYYEMGRCFLAQASFDSAETMIRKCLEFKLNHASVWYFLGEIERQKDLTEKALVSFEKALSLDPRMFEAFNGIGRILKEKGDYLKAQEAYRKSLKLMEYQPEITADLADCYLRNNHMKEALFLYRKALSEAPERAVLWFKTATAYVLRGEAENAVPLFREGLLRDSTNAEMHYNLGHTFVLQRRFPEAIEAFRKAIRFNDREPDYYNNLAMSYKESGRREEAIRIFEQGLRRFPGSRLLLENYQQIR